MRALNSPISTTLALPERNGRQIGFVGLFAVAIAARALLLTAMPLQALTVMGDAQTVSLVYFLASLASVITSLTVPSLLARFPRPLVFAAGCCLGAAGPLLASLPHGLALGLGLAAQIASVALIEITLNLYVLEQVPRRRLAGFESLRLFTSAAAWAAGPWLGIQLQERLHHDAPFVASAVMALLLLVVFAILRPRAKSSATRTAPLNAIGGFFRQPRLRLAWVLAMGRSCWWVMFFVYGPILLVDQLGYDRGTAGAIASLVMCVTFLVPLWSWIGRRITLRRLLILGYAISGLVTLLLALVQDPRWLAAGVLILASVLTSMIDGAGNVPFLRAVKPLQKAQMTAVFMTYRDASQVGAPGVYAALLAVFPLSSVFVVTGLTMLSLAGLARHIPKRL